MFLVAAEATSAAKLAEVCSTDFFRKIGVYWHHLNHTYVFRPMRLRLLTDMLTDIDMSFIKMSIESSAI